MLYIYVYISSCSRVVVYPHYFWFICCFYSPNLPTFFVLFYFLPLYCLYLFIIFFCIFLLPVCKSVWCRLDSRGGSATGHERAAYAQAISNTYNKGIKTLLVSSDTTNFILVHAFIMTYYHPNQLLCLVIPYIVYYQCGITNGLSQ